jgi:negative regulator of replication initiation
MTKTNSITGTNDRPKANLRSSLKAVWYAGTQGAQWSVAEAGYLKDDACDFVTTKATEIGDQIAEHINQRRLAHGLELQPVEPKQPQPKQSRKAVAVVRAAKDTAAPQVSLNEVEELIQSSEERQDRKTAAQTEALSQRLDAMEDRMADRIAERLMAMMSSQQAAA